MLTSATTVVERRTVLRGDHVTEPYEAGWALEAMVFMQVEGAHPALSIQPQVSPDGIHWLDYGTPVVLAAKESLAGGPVLAFGTWLRFAVTGASENSPAEVLIHLTMKG